MLQTADQQHMHSGTVDWQAVLVPLFECRSSRRVRERNGAEIHRHSSHQIRRKVESEYLHLPQCQDCVKR